MTPVLDPRFQAQGTITGTIAIRLAHGDAYLCSKEKLGVLYDVKRDRFQRSLNSSAARTKLQNAELTPDLELPHIISCPPQAVRSTS